MHCWEVLFISCVWIHVGASHSSVLCVFQCDFVWQFCSVEMAWRELQKLSPRGEGESCVLWWSREMWACDCRAVYSSCLHTSNLDSSVCESMGSFWRSLMIIRFKKLIQMYVLRTHLTYSTIQREERWLQNYWLWKVLLVLVYADFCPFWRGSHFHKVCLGALSSGQCFAHCGFFMFPFFLRICFFSASTNSYLSFSPLAYFCFSQWIPFIFLPQVCVVQWFSEIFLFCRCWRLLFVLMIGETSRRNW